MVKMYYRINVAMYAVTKYVAELRTIILCVDVLCGFVYMIHIMVGCKQILHICSTALLVVYGGS